MQGPMLHKSHSYSIIFRRPHSGLTRTPLLSSAFCAVGWDTAARIHDASEHQLNFFQSSQNLPFKQRPLYKLGVKIRLEVKDWTNTITLPTQTKWPKLTYYQIKHTQLTSRSTLFLPKFEISLLLHSAWWLKLLVKPGNGLNKVVEWTLSSV